MELKRCFDKTVSPTIRQNLPGPSGSRGEKLLLLSPGWASAEALAWIVSGTWQAVEREWARLCGKCWAVTEGKHGMILMEQWEENGISQRRLSQVQCRVWWGTPSVGWGLLGWVRMGSVRAGLVISPQG